MVQQRASTLPAQLTPFIGRTEELAELKNLLSDPNCRLVTLVGPGGGGKSRLAVEVARELEADFPDGAFFVPLQPVASAEFVVPAIADSIQFSLRGPAEPEVQLISHLADKHLLLVLDNFEHVMSAAGLLSEMLSAAPKLRLIVTSREALNLGEEWVFPLPGMRFPESPSVDAAGSYDAVTLFVERAGRVRRGYSPEGDWAAITRLCHLVRGMPLAIELAASWIKVLPCDEIVAEIERSLDFLATNVRNVPERHRSVRAVFEESWNLLSEQERDAFTRLSVFQGSFGREAAETLAGASLSLLSTFVDKSLLRPLPQGRYEVHELLRQYTFEKLAESPEQVALAQGSHCAYYLDFVRRRAADLLGGRQIEAGAEIEAELDNVRPAWQWAADHGEADYLRETVDPLGQCWQFKSRYAEAVAVLEGATRSLEARKPDEEIALALAALLVELAWFYVRLGRVPEAEAAANKGLGIYEAHSADPIPGFGTDPRQVLGIIATIKAEYPQAARLGQQSLQVAEKQDNPWNRQLAHYVLARAAFLQGEHADARRHAEEARNIAAQQGDRWFLAYCLIELGNVACALDDLAGAREHYQASYDLRKEFADPEGMAIALTYLGDVTVRQRDHAAALSLYEQSISIYREIGDRGGLAASLCGMAKAALALEEHESARGLFRQALEAAADVQHVPLILSIAAGAAGVLVAAGDVAGGLQLIALAVQHPGSDHETKSWARSLAEPYEADLPPADVSPAVALLTRALGLTGDLGLSAMLAAAWKSHAEQAAADYPDDLSEREVEVLRLIAGGKSNQQIAEALYITTNTVANHVKNILSKTGCANRTEAAAYAFEKQLT